MTKHPLGWRFAPEININDMIPKEGFCEECKQTKRLGMVALRKVWDHDTAGEYEGPLEFIARGFCIDCIKLKAARGDFKP